MDLLIKPRFQKEVEFIVCGEDYEESYHFSHSLLSNERYDL